MKRNWEIPDRAKFYWTWLPVHLTHKMRLKGNKNKVTDNWEVIFSSIKLLAKHIFGY
jgi:hypothetical protein